MNGETMETVTDCIFLGSKITADGDCSHEIKRPLLLGRKSMTNLDSILKSRYYFANKDPCSKAMGFPGVMYGCESWTIKKSEYQKMDAFELWYWESLDCKEIKPVNPKGNQSWISLEGLMLKLKLQYFGHLMWRTDSLEKTLMLGKIEGRRIRGWQRMRWLDGITDSTDEFGQFLGVGDGQGSLGCCSPLGCKESDMNEWLNWTEKMKKVYVNLFAKQK